MEKIAIHTEKAPKAIGTYSQAIRVGQTVYLTDLAHFPLINQTMERCFRPPYPARAAVAAAALPRSTSVAVDAVMVMPG